MQTESGDRAADFASAALPWLERDPVTNNILVTVTEAVRDAGSPGSFAAPGDAFVWAIARDTGGEIAGAAACTPPYPLVLTGTNDASAAALAERFAADGFAATGVSGPKSAAEAFAARWAALGRAAESARDGLLVYRLDAVVPPPPVPGAMRTAGPADRDLLLRWTDGFLAEVHVGSGAERAETVLDPRLDTGRVSVWDAGGETVAMTGTSPPVAGVTRVSLVYTPPEHRRRGYAAALVAAVSERELDAGATCMLFTEASNPTSNGVYTRIGYTLVGANVQITFG